jgi:hypothetical protein
VERECGAGREGIAFEEWNVGDREEKGRGREVDMISLQGDNWKIRAAVEPELGLRTGMAWLDFVWPLFGLWRARGCRELLE